MLAGLVTIYLPSTMQAEAATLPYLAVEPARYHASAVNEIFTVNIVAHDIISSSSAIGFEFRLRYNTTLLQILAVNNGTFLEGFAGTPNRGVFYLGPVYGADYVLFGGYIVPDENGVWHEPFPSGTGTVASIQFKAIYGPPGKAVSSDLTLYNTKLANPTSIDKSLPHSVVSGTYDLTLTALVGDLDSNGVVDIFDALILANAFGTSPENPRWNVAADINNDGQVDIFDAILLGIHFGQR
jgi:hypothetical protein